MRVVGPVTKSPQAKTPRTFVAYVAGSTLIRPRLTSKVDSTGRNVRSAAWETAGMTVSALITNSEPGIGTGERRPGRVRLAELVADELDAGELAVLAEELDRAGEELHPDALALGLAELLLVDHELGAGPPVDDRDVLGAVAEAGPRAVHRGVAAADDDDVLADLERLAEVGVLHEVDAVLDAVEVRARARRARPAFIAPAVMAIAS